MLGQIRRLGTETAIYGFSTVVGRFLTFVLTPLYANLLVPGDLGIVATLYAYIAFLNVLYHYGMDVAYMKYVSTLELGGRKETFSVPFLAVLISSALLSGLLWFSGTEVGEMVGTGAGNAYLVRYGALIVFLDAVAIVPFAALRMERKARQFAVIRIAGILINVVCAVLFLIGLDMGMEGIFLAGVISSASTVLLLLPTIAGNLAPAWSGPMFRALLAYGLPTLPAGLAAIALQVIDRPILEYLTDANAVGVYQANYRLGIFMMLVVSMFEFAWRPFSFNAGNDAEAKKLFARVLTYLLLGMTGIFLALSFFLEGLVKTPLFFGYSILPPAYWGGYDVVALVLGGYMFLGVATVFSAGLYLEKKTALLPVITISGAVVNIAANFLLIPSFGITGAGLATLVSYAVMAVLMYVFAQRHSPVPYEWGRVLRILAVGLVTFGAGHLVTPPVPSALWHLVLLAASLLVLRLLKFYDPEELDALRRLFRRPTADGNSP